MIINKAILVKTVQLSRVVKVIFHLTGSTELDFLRLKQMLKSEGFLLFSHDKIKQDVEAAMKDRKIGITTSGKSKSAILRDVIFQYWNEVYKGDKSFEEYYNLAMDHEIKTVRSRYNEKIHDNDNG